MTSLVPVVLCGGSGTRFWPLSTDANPKQFLRLWQGKSLFQITIARLSGRGAAPALIICNKVHEAEIRRQLAEIGAGEATILLEPERRDSAAAIAVAAAWVARRHGADVPIGIFPSDQLIGDEAAFRHALDLAAILAREGRLVTFGITPDRPATEFGYVERAAPIAAHPGAFEVASFHEKPEAAVAAGYIASGRFDWNSGMFVFTAAGFLAQAEIHMKAILDAARLATTRAVEIGGAWHLDAEAFGQAEKKSIDYALFEHASGVATVPVACGWSDVGNWRSAQVELPKDAAGNVVIGDAKAKETAGSIIVTDGLPVRVLGVEGLAVVVSAAGVLVTRLEDAARLKEIV
ncbi:mannose-1-phosphate guanyltransferase [Oleomonas cavernae]|uniref:Mannose-1-phosphate guanyltransferase n=1 Tax=Oleomonas cavernae TaxID=2320859 RepID=A0A418WTE4_9PROT|nr:sugar phosphate nucleotidyltransferase [Oleomonas cavernae]RJF94498.1 mannose-1-phosphate guanyltransferase [Oleomonas cavernae]